MAIEDLRNLIAIYKRLRKDYETLGLMQLPYGTIVHKIHNTLTEIKSIEDKTNFKHLKEVVVKYDQLIKELEETKFDGEDGKFSLMDVLNAKRQKQ